MRSGCLCRSPICPIDVISAVGLDQKARKSRWPARLDVLQSASGLFLGLFMWGHMAFVSTILISKDTMWWVTRLFEGQFVLGERYPGIVASIVALVAVMFVVHGFWPCVSSRLIFKSTKVSGVIEK